MHLMHYKFYGVVHVYNMVQCTCTCTLNAVYTAMDNIEGLKSVLNCSLNADLKMFEIINVQHFHTVHC